MNRQLLRTFPLWCKFSCGSPTNMCVWTYKIPSENFSLCTRTHIWGRAELPPEIKSWLRPCLLSMYFALRRLLIANSDCLFHLVNYQNFSKFCDKGKQPAWRAFVVVHGGYVVAARITHRPIMNAKSKKKLKKTRGEELFKNRMETEKKMTDLY